MRRRYLKYINPWVQSLIRLVTVLEKKRKEMILTLLTLNHGNQPPNKFLIALPFPCILIIHSLPCICSWLWIFLFQQHLVRFQEAHLNDCIFFSFPCSGLLYIYMLVFLSGLSCLFSAGALSASFHNTSAAHLERYTFSYFPELLPAGLEDFSWWPPDRVHHLDLQQTIF